MELVGILLYLPNSGGTGFCQEYANMEKIHILFCGSLFTTNYCGKDDARWVIETNDDADEWFRQATHSHGLPQKLLLT